MLFSYPFTYDVIDDRRSFALIALTVRDNYLKWLDTKDEKYLEAAVPDLASYVGKMWKQSIGVPMDLECLDKVAYRFVMRFYNNGLPSDYKLPSYLWLSVRRDLIRAYYKTYLPEGDRSVREFSYHPFMSPADIEHKIFVGEMVELLIKHIECGTRLDESERAACKYLATVIVQEKMPSPLILKSKYGIPYKNQQFYVDFTTVVLRNELYKLRDSLPCLYSNERKPFIPPGDDDEFEEERDLEEIAEFCDF